MLAFFHFADLKKPASCLNFNSLMRFNHVLENKNYLGNSFLHTILHKKHIKFLIEVFFAHT